MGSTGNATLQGVTISAHSLFTSDRQYHHDAFWARSTTWVRSNRSVGTGRTHSCIIADAVTLTGGGTVLLDTIATNGGSAFIFGNGNTLTNTNNTILGTGVIGNGNLVLVNSGVIDATPEGGTAR